MTVLIKIAQFIVSLSILVIIHEFGHFLMAKLFKTRVEKFYLFFDPWFSLFKLKRGETEYGVGWLPLGGYVKISGMIDESLDREQLKKPAEPWEFRSKPSWQRLLIMTGGVLFNFILAFLIYVAVLYAWGETYLPTANAKYGIVTDSTGHALGLRNGDKILAVDGQYIENFTQITTDILLNDRKTIQVGRDGKEVNINITREYIKNALKGFGRIEARVPFKPFVIVSFMKKSPAREAGLQVDDEIIGIDGKTFSFYDEYQKYLSENKGQPVLLNILRDGNELSYSVKPDENGMFRIAIKNVPSLELKTIHYGLIRSVPAGVSKGLKMIGDYLKQFKLLFSKDTKAYESLGGFITIGNIFPDVWDWEAFWNLTAFLSIILAVMNILPIPALDGGHVMFLLFEVVTGRKPSDKFLEYAQIAGMVILISLLLFANGNDIVKLFRK